MEADAAHGWFAQVNERFPGQAVLLRQLALSDRAFRSLCEDYALARASLTSFQARADARERPEIADYRTVIAELEGEIARALTVAGRRR
jgi:hypothetical protein